MTRLWTHGSLELNENVSKYERYLLSKAFQSDIFECVVDTRDGKEVTFLKKYKENHYPTNIENTSTLSNMPGHQALYLKIERIFSDKGLSSKIKRTLKLIDYPLNIHEGPYDVFSDSRLFDCFDSLVKKFRGTTVRTLYYPDSYFAIISAKEKELFDEEMAEYGYRNLDKPDYAPKNTYYLLTIGSLFLKERIYKESIAMSHLISKRGCPSFSNASECLKYIKEAKTNIDKGEMFELEPLQNDYLQYLEGKAKQTDFFECVVETRGKANIEVFQRIYILLKRYFGNNQEKETSILEKEANVIALSKNKVPLLGFRKKEGHVYCSFRLISLSKGKKKWDLGYDVFNATRIFDVIPEFAMDFNDELIANLYLPSLYQIHLKHGDLKRFYKTMAVFGYKESSLECYATLDEKCYEFQMSSYFARRREFKEANKESFLAAEKGSPYFIRDLDALIVFLNNIRKQSEKGKNFERIIA